MLSRLLLLFHLSGGVLASKTSQQHGVFFFVSSSFLLLNDRPFPVLLPVRQTRRLRPAQFATYTNSKLGCRTMKLNAFGWSVGLVGFGQGFQKNICRKFDRIDRVFYFEPMRLCLTSSSIIMSSLAANLIAREEVVR